MSEHLPEQEHSPLPGGQVPRAGDERQPLAVARAVCAVASVGYSSTLMVQQRLMALAPGLRPTALRTADDVTG